MGAYEKALELYERAYAADPTTCTSGGISPRRVPFCTIINGAIRWWWKVINSEKHPSYYRRLAYNLACSGDLDQAAEHCKKAVALNDRDAGTYADWGNVLYHLGLRHEVGGEFERPEPYTSRPARSICEHYVSTPGGRNTITWLLRLAEVRFALKQYVML